MRIGPKAFLALLAKAAFIQGHFPRRGAKPAQGPSYSDAGYQITIGLKLPLMAKGKRVGERTEWHTIQVGSLPAERPETYLHASYGEVGLLRLLIAEEIKRVRKDKATPRFRAYPATWGHDGERPATFTVKAGGDVDHDIHNNVYTFEAGSHYDNGHVQVNIASFAFEPGNKYGHNEWSGPVDEEKNYKSDMGRYFYTYDASIESIEADLPVVESATTVTTEGN